MSKAILVVDIETSGFLNQGGKIVEIGIVKLNLDNGNITPAFSSLINEEGFNKKHTQGRFGWIFRNSDLEFTDVMQAPSLESQRKEIQELFNKYPATAYNKDFDFGFLENRGFQIKELPCPMLLATPIINLPPANGYGSPKWPKVEEAWKFFFGDTGYVEAHRGLDDAKHEAKIVYELYERGCFEKDLNSLQPTYKDFNTITEQIKEDSGNYSEIIEEYKSGCFDRDLSYYEPNFPEWDYDPEEIEEEPKLYPEIIIDSKIDFFDNKLSYYCNTPPNPYFKNKDSEQKQYFGQVSESKKSTIKSISKEPTPMDIFITTEVKDKIIIEVNNVILRISDKYDVIKAFGSDYVLEESNMNDYVPGYWHCNVMNYKKLGVNFKFVQAYGLVQIDVIYNPATNVFLNGHILNIVGDAIAIFGKPEWFSEPWIKTKNSFSQKVYLDYFFNPEFNTDKDSYIYKEYQQIKFSSTYKFDLKEVAKIKEKYKNNWRRSFLDDFDEENFIHNNIEQISIQDFHFIPPW